MLNIKAFQVSETINLKNFKLEFKANLNYGNNFELFYTTEHQRFVFVLNYGVVVLAGYDEIAQSEFIRFVKNFTENTIDINFTEDFMIEFNDKPSKAQILNDRVILPSNADENSIKIVMFHVAQSVGLDYYEKLTDNILGSTEVFTKQLEQFGHFKISRKNLLKFIGKILNIKNSIADNLYIIDDPAYVWDDDKLDYLNRQLKELFDIHTRFREVDYRLKIVESNLKFFADILQHRESARLEWIVIGLILIEVIDLLYQYISKIRF
jgi:required for meiotic nuclear division protein 1